MTSPKLAPKSRSQPEIGVPSELSAAPLPGDSTHAGSALLGDDPGSKSPNLSYSMPKSPELSRNPSFSNSSAYRDDASDDGSFFPPMDRLTVFDFIENLALPQRLEKIQTSIHQQTEKVRRQQARLKSTGQSAKDRVVDEWRRRLPTPDEQLDKYKKRMRDGVDKLSTRWNDNKAVTAREKLSFISGVMNVFVSGYLVGAHPEWFHYWYTAQLFYFMPIRLYTYHKKGYHYFLADLCYFVNLLAVLSIWVFPNSKRLFISTYCLAMGNNAMAIAMWRNSFVFHSLDKVTSLFIHIMPCVTLHCLVHLVPPSLQATRFPAIHTIRTSLPTSPEHYTLPQMLLWATCPYAVWQLSYHLLITVRRREKIRAGRPTSFTWLRKSYAPTLLGKLVLSLPESLQEPAFMGIQYFYACITMVPCPIWFWHRWASGGFLAAVFIWSVYNGATYYIDVFGRRWQKELEALKMDVAKWQGSPEGVGAEGRHGSVAEQKEGDEGMKDGAEELKDTIKAKDERRSSLDHIPPLDGATGVKVEGEGDGSLRERK